MKWRYIPLIEASGAKQMAIDEAMLKARSKGIVDNTLRFFTWKPPCITLGYFQSAQREVDFEKAKALEVDVVRRYTGGGAVFHDQELTYSMVLSEEDVSSDIIESYKQICEFIIRGLAHLGLKAEFYPINDILVNGKKISGNAQTRKDGVVLQHGTILLDVNPKKMFSLLKVPDEKLKNKMIAAVEERVTGINKQAPQPVALQDLIEAMKQGFEEVFGGLTPGNLTEFELMNAELLKHEKYGSEEYLRCR